MAVNWSSYRLAPDFSGLAAGIQGYFQNRQAAEIAAANQAMEQQKMGMEQAYRDRMLALQEQKIMAPSSQKNQFYADVFEKDGNYFRVGNDQAGNPIIIEMPKGFKPTAGIGGQIAFAPQLVQMEGQKTGATEEAKTKEMVQREKVLQDQANKIKEQNLSLAKQEQEFALMQTQASLKEFKGSDAIQLADELYNSDLKSIYGWGESFYPDQFRSEEGQLNLANRNRLVGLLNLAAAQENKGQGSLSDAERKTMADSATVLANPNISEKAAKKEIARIRGFLNKIYGLPDTPIGSTSAPTQTQETYEQRRARLLGQ